MAHIRVIHDPVGQTLAVSWKSPSPDQICEETGEGVILIKDRQTGEVIGFERLYYRPEAEIQAVTVETVEASLSSS
ncbi:MAG: hypothetical protein N3E42_05485 [Candidatus Bipolaricaulota bacterium]|nr:hypothetical protein [Candidatus Bipolaricaulota bacterium]